MAWASSAQPVRWCWRGAGRASSAEPMRGMTRTRGIVVAAVALAAVAAVLLAVGLSRQSPAPPSVPRSAATEPESAGNDVPAPSDGATGPESRDDAGQKVRGPVLPPSDPVRIAIPSIDVTSSLVNLGRQEDGAMETPRDPGKAGWYTPGPTPGEQGPAVIAGHVTWNGEKSVFFPLGKLGKGDRVNVAREDGSTAKFEVERVERYPKDDFPTVEVYRNLDHAGLRLITCGGAYDDDAHYYRDNVVVFASMVE
ncbi:hypothetical protein N566_21970 [Streptomycetaceae bacterium MP113-05]|nr:hypothetical protein N566_21970 [Streptomycetaceae bacterium MP113-05]